MIGRHYAFGVHDCWTLVKDYYESVGIKLRDWKRPTDPETIEKVVSKTSRELEEIGQSEIQSSVIGKKVMDSLKELDKIAYIRFASVYTNFKEVGEFGEYIEKLDAKPKK